MTTADTSRTKVLLLAVMKRRVASIKAVIAVLTLCVSVLGIAACGGEAQQQQKEAQQAPQKAAGSGSDAEQGLVGTWEVVETDQGTDLAGGLWTFSSDGTFQAQPLPEDAPDIVLPAQYRADGSHIYFIDPETGAESQTEYTLNGDTLTTHVEVAHPEFPIAQTATFKRKS